MLSSLVKKAINRVARLGDRLTEDMHFLLRGIQFSPSTVDPADTCLGNSAFDRVVRMDMHTEGFSRSRNS